MTHLEKIKKGLLPKVTGITTYGAIIDMPDGEIISLDKKEWDNWKINNEYYIEI